MRGSGIALGISNNYLITHDWGDLQVLLFIHYIVGIIIIQFLIIALLAQLIEFLIV